MKMIIQNMESQALGRKIRVNVAVPEHYNPAQAYPVLYMHDGQNVFDLRHHRVHDWHVNHIADNMHLSWIIVAVDSPEDSLKRFDLYYPWQIHNLDTFLPSKNLEKGLVCGGNAHMYANFFVHELIPKIEREYSVQPLRALAGSSLGAITSMYIANEYPIFNYLGLLSPAIWFDKDRFLDYCHNIDFAGVHVYLSMGTNENSDDNISDFPQIYITQAQMLICILQDKTCSLTYHVDEGGTHDGRSWHHSMNKFIHSYLAHHQLLGQP